MSSIMPWLICITLLCTPALAADKSPPTVVVSPDCLVSLIEQALVPARRPGQVERVLHSDGADVAQGEVLVQLDDLDARARYKCAELELDIARHKAECRALYKAARESSALEELEFDNSSQLFKRNVIAKLEHARERTEAELAKIKIEETEAGCVQADLVRQLREAELQLAAIELADHEVRAPYDGVIAELFHRTGDWVEPEQPVLRLLRMDRLKVETFLDSRQVAPHRALGLPVTVVVPIAGDGNRSIENCRIDYVAPELEPGGEFRVWVEVDNLRHASSAGAAPQWLLRPGMTAEIRVQLSPDQTEPQLAGDQLAGTSGER